MQSLFYSNAFTDNAKKKQKDWRLTLLTIFKPIRGHRGVMLKANFRQEVCIFKVENGNKHKLITRAYNNTLQKA